MSYAAERAGWRGLFLRPKTEADQSPGLPRRKSIMRSSSSVNNSRLLSAPYNATFPVLRTRAASCFSFRCLAGALPRGAQPTIIATAFSDCNTPRSTGASRRHGGDHNGEGPACADPSLNPTAEAACKPTDCGDRGRRSGPYLMILATTPAPTVRPPSRIAKRRPSSIATGLISDTAIFTLSPGITISTPSGSSHAPVMSVVRK